MCVYKTLLCSFVFAGSMGTCCETLIALYFFFQGVWARVYETLIVLFLLAMFVFGLAWVASAIFDDNTHSKQTLFGMYVAIGWSYAFALHMSVCRLIETPVLYTLFWLKEYFVNILTGPFT